MKKSHLWLPLAFFIGACVAWQSTRVPPQTPTGAPLPEVSAERRKAALFYSDLGPDAVDVSSYPAERRRQYAIYAQVCSRCHTLARSINAPYVSRAWWEFYVLRMRTRAKVYGNPFTKQEIKTVLDYLEYDSNERKVARAAEFDATKAELKRRFEAALDERIETLQKQSQPRLIP